jgi:hypothetical protein
MREQVSSSRSFDPDKPEIRTKLSSLKKSGISDPRLCLCEYRPRAQLGGRVRRKKEEKTSMSTVAGYIPGLG